MNKLKAVLRRLMRLKKRAQRSPERGTRRHALDALFSRQRRIETLLHQLIQLQDAARRTSHRVEQRLSVAGIGSQSKTARDNDTHKDIPMQGDPVPVGSPLEDGMPLLNSPEAIEKWLAG